MKIGIVKEQYSREQRVALTPDSIPKLQKMGFDVLIEAGAGVPASFNDLAYEESGATVVTSAESVFQDADVIVKVRAPDESELELLREGQNLMSFLWPAQKS